MHPGEGSRGHGVGGLTGMGNAARERGQAKAVWQRVTQPNIHQTTNQHTLSKLLHHRRSGCQSHVCWHNRSHHFYGSCLPTGLPLLAWLAGWLTPLAAPAACSCLCRSCCRPLPLPGTAHIASVLQKDWLLFSYVRTILTPPGTSPLDPLLTAERVGRRCMLTLRSPRGEGGRPSRPAAGADGAAE